MITEGAEFMTLKTVRIIVILQYISSLTVFENHNSFLSVCSYTTCSSQKKKKKNPGKLDKKEATVLRLYITLKHPLVLRVADY